MVTITNKFYKLSFKNSTQELSVADVANAREYIKNYWPKLIRHNVQDQDDLTLIGLPNPYLVPATEETHAFDFNEMYYWDSYFMCRGLLHNPDNKNLVLGIIDNFIYIFNRFNVIPNANRAYLMGRSQPPLLTSLIFDVYDSFNMDKAWLKKCILVAQNEYNNVWMGTKKPHDRKVYEDLSRNYDINLLHDLAETESGWDMTPRFSRKALNYLPVDLNSLLYKYELDFARAAGIFGNVDQKKTWLAKALARKTTIDKLMWSNIKGLYYDYDFTKRKRGEVSSLAAYYPMWVGMASKEQAKKLVRNLRKFEQKGGLATTDQQLKTRLPTNLQLHYSPEQWAYPNGWAPLQLIVIEGLEKYGYHTEAARIAQKWLKTNLSWFNNNQVFLEKYNVVQPSKAPLKGLYPTQVGFGWTNAVFEMLCKRYVDS